MPDNPPPHILVADDDSDDCLLTGEAFRESRLTNEVRFVHNGEELLNYLRGAPPFADRQRYPLPGLILLDLNMPLKDGREALVEIKADPRLRSIPVVILTTSAEEEDILRCYANGANSFITKPVSFSGLLAVVQALGHYWLDIVALPAEHKSL